MAKKHPALRPFALFAVAILIICQACSQEPANYNECILENVKSGMSDAAVVLVQQACREEFPEPERPARPVTAIPAEALERLTGRLGHRYGTMWGGNIYNGNSEWFITEVRILLTGRLDERGYQPIGAEPAEAEPKTEAYSVRVSISPLANHDFSFSANWLPSEQYEWRIVEAKGYVVD